MYSYKVIEANQRIETVIRSNQVLKGREIMTSMTPSHCCHHGHSQPGHPHPKSHDTSPKTGIASSPDDSQGTYTCPMHPEVISDRFGSCPKCGMALERTTSTLQESNEENPELQDMTRRFWVAVVLTVPLMVLAMSSMAQESFIARWVSAHQRVWLELVLATPVCLWAAWPFYERCVQSLKHKHPNMFTLIGLGVGVSYGYSVAAVLWPELFPASYQMQGHVQVYFETAAMIVTLVLLGQVLELRARGQVSQAIHQLLEKQANTAWRIGPDGTETQVPIQEIRVGDQVRVRPGQTMPVDGVVLEGTSAVDESMMTGEPVPVTKRLSDAVMSGTINGTGGLIIRATGVGADSLLARMIALVKEAQRSRAPIQRLADTASAYFVPTVITIAVVTFGVWSVWGPEPKLAYAVINAVAVLMVACPCALGLATPMSIMVATSQGAMSGVLFRNAEAIERLGTIDTLVMDKTGTLTEGHPKLASITSQGQLNENEFLRLSASLEQGSEHPLAKAVVDEARARGLELSLPSAVESIPGKGVQGRVENRQVKLGNRTWMGATGATFAENEAWLAEVQSLQADGQTVVCVSLDDRVVGALGIADPIKPSAPLAIDTLRKEGIHLVMLTGDSTATAHAVAGALGITDVVAEVLPDKKHNVIKRLQASGHVVAMAGDGINDAPALEQAQVGIAMGTGADVAMQSADVTLVKGDLNGIVRAKRLSQRTMTNIKQNLFFAFVYNAVGVPVAAGVLYPAFGILLSPMIAAAAMSLSSVCVIGNALRLR